MTSSSSLLYCGNISDNPENIKGDIVIKNIILNYWNIQLLNFWRQNLIKALKFYFKVDLLWTEQIKHVVRFLSMTKQLLEKVVLPLRLFSVLCLPAMEFYWRVCLVFDCAVLIHTSEWEMEGLQVCFFSASTLLLHHSSLCWAKVS